MQNLPQRQADADLGERAGYRRDLLLFLKCSGSGDPLKYTSEPQR